MLGNKIEDFDQIYNADENGLFCKLIPQRIFVHQAES